MYAFIYSISILSFLLTKGDVCQLPLVLYLLVYRYSKFETPKTYTEMQLQDEGKRGHMTVSPRPGVRGSLSVFCIRRTYQAFKLPLILNYRKLTRVREAVPQKTTTPVQFPMFPLPSCRVRTLTTTNVILQGKLVSRHSP
jgi:hypothetical protein